MKKLLSKPIRAFTMYALVILLCSIPVYYWVVDKIWVHELDEHNMIVKEMVIEGIRKAAIRESSMDELLLLWNTIQPGTRLIPVTHVQEKDSFYTVTRKTVEEADRLRGLASGIVVNGRGYRLIIETNVEEADETIAAISTITIVFFTLLAGGFILLNRRISKNVWRPFKDTLTSLQQFDLSRDSKLQFTPTDIEEFHQLNVALDRLISQNIQVFQQQKLFIENASHELQTPLAVLKSKLEVLLQHSENTSEQLDILQALEAPVARMSRINKNLLLLARLENNQFAAVGTADLSRLITESIPLLSGYIEDKFLVLNIDLPPTFNVTANSFLLETLVNNLLTNSIRHTQARGSISISLKNDVLQVSNTGDDALESSRLFLRFAVSSATSASSGLGLAIVKEICSRYGWSLSYKFQDGNHCFSVRFS